MGDSRASPPDQTWVGLRLVRSLHGFPVVSGFREQRVSASRFISTFLLSSPFAAIAIVRFLNQFDTPEVLANVLTDERQFLQEIRIFGERFDRRTQFLRAIRNFGERLN